MLVFSRKELEIILSQLKDFLNPKEFLEQWMTPPEIASSMIWVAQKDVRNKIVADLGAGTGILGIGALLIGANKVYFVEIDKEALKICKENLAYVEKLFNKKFNYELVNCDVRDFKLSVDTVIMNPPWGLEKSRKYFHIDRIFLIVAFSIAKTVYALLYHSNRLFSIYKRIAKENNFEISVLATVRFPLKWKFKHHRKPVRFVMADFICAKKKEQLRESS